MNKEKKKKLNNYKNLGSTKKIYMKHIQWNIYSINNLENV